MAANLKSFVNYVFQLTQLILFESKNLFALSTLSTKNKIGWAHLNTNVKLITKKLNMQPFMNKVYSL